MKETKLILILSLIVASYFFLHSAGMASFADDYVTRSGKSLYIEESNPHGQSLSNIHLKSSGFEHNHSESFEDRDPIKSVYISDLDGNLPDTTTLSTMLSHHHSFSLTKQNE